MEAKDRNAVAFCTAVPFPTMLLESCHNAIEAFAVSSVTDSVTLNAEPATSSAVEVEFASCPVKLTAAIACEMAADKTTIFINGRQCHGCHQGLTGLPMVALYSCSRAG